MALSKTLHNGFLQYQLLLGTNLLWTSVLSRGHRIFYTQQKPGMSVRLGATSLRILTIWFYFLVYATNLLKVNTKPKKSSFSVGRVQEAWFPRGGQPQHLQHQTLGDFRTLAALRCKSKHFSLFIILVDFA